MAKTLHYDFLNYPTLTGSSHPVATSPDLSITRATKATMVDADGYIREVQAGEARFTGATFRNNEILYSEDLSNAAWSMVAGNKGSESATRYTGETATVGYIVDDGAAANVRLQQQWRTDGTVGEVYVLSAYLKKRGANGRWGYILAADDGIAAYFDLVNGVLGTEINSPQAAITDVGNGWYRCSIVTTATDISPRINIYVAEGDNDVGIASPDTTYSIYVDAVQAEVASGSGRTTPSTYIKTTTVAKSSLTGTSTKGLLVEEARTNIIVQSEDFSTTWGPGADTVVNTNQTTAPDGSTTADRIIDDSGGGTTTTVWVQGAHTVATSTAYTYSFFAKADGLSLAAVKMLNFTTPANSEAWFNLSAGTVGTVDAGFSDSGIEDYGNGWYRCWVVFTTDGTDTAGFSRIGPAQSDGSETVDADGTSSIFVWGAQMEAGAFPTSYIATTTASVTRNADIVNTTDLSWYNNTEGTFYDSAQNSQAVINNSSGYLWSINNNAYGERWANTRGSSGGAANNDTKPLIQVSAGVDFGQFTAQTNNWVGDTISRCVQAAQENDYNFYVDGIGVTPKTSGAMPTTAQLATFDVGSDQANTIFWNGHIAEIAYFNERLANATLDDYSTNGLPTAFPGTVAGDGGHIWPARSNDPRWAQIITDSGITPSGNFIDDVHAALEAMASDTGAMDDLWKKVKAVYSITDTSEPFSY